MEHAQKLLCVISGFLLLAHAAPAIAQTNHFVWSGGGHASPYTNWTTAAHDIQSAIDASADGATIWVTNGVYDTGGRSNYPAGSGLTNRVSIYRAIAVRSVNGPTNADGTARTSIVGRWHVPGDTNAICGSNAVRCVYMVNGSELIGFTLTNGATAASSGYNSAFYGGGIYAQSTAAAISNCVITGNAAYTYGGGGYYGTYYDCDITDNILLTAGAGAGVIHANIHRCRVLNNRIVTTSGMGGGVYGGNVYDSVIMGNFARSGAGARSATVYNSLIYSNSAGFNGGGASECTLYNCVVAGNSGTRAGGVNTDIISTNYNCVIIGNIGAGWFSGGVYGQGKAVLYNCIVLDNAGGNYAGTVEFHNSCASPLPAGEGNMNVDPLFLDRGSGVGFDYVLGDYRLSRYSPCLDRGTTFSWQQYDPDGKGRDRDFYGKQRYRHQAVDIGASESKISRGSLFKAE